MSEAKDAASDAANDTAARKGKSKLLLGACVLALLAGGGGFYAVYAGFDPVAENPESLSRSSYPA